MFFCIRTPAKEMEYAVMVPAVFVASASVAWLYTSIPWILNCACSVLQIVALNKTKERMRPYHSHQEDEDPDIKKIKKVRGGGGGFREHSDQLSIL